MTWTKKIGKKFLNKDKYKLIKLLIKVISKSF